MGIGVQHIPVPDLDEIRGVALDAYEINLSDEEVITYRDDVIANLTLHRTPPY